MDSQIVTSIELRETDEKNQPTEGNTRTAIEKGESTVEGSQQKVEGRPSVEPEKPRKKYEQPGQTTVDDFHIIKKLGKS